MMNGVACDVFHMFSRWDSRRDVNSITELGHVPRSPFTERPSFLTLSILLVSSLRRPASWHKVYPVWSSCFLDARRENNPLELGQGSILIVHTIAKKDLYQASEVSLLMQADNETRIQARYGALGPWGR